uniref:Uncharacterized protein n=1 Tax=Physcomitrium patens TaxID=3218 RepID=A0A2K1KN53_PHYPA|nr:hypothetical protein PHYPA_006103 [Physcomitrium patens]
MLLRRHTSSCTLRSEYVHKVLAINLTLKLPLQPTRPFRRRWLLMMYSKNQKRSLARQQQPLIRIKTMQHLVARSLPQLPELRQHRRKKNRHCCRDLHDQRTRQRSLQYVSDFPIELINRWKF